MKSRIGAGLLAGGIAGIAFGIVEMFFHVALKDGTVVPDLNLAGRTLGATDMGASWLLQIIGTAVLGGIFAAIFYNKTYTNKASMGWGLLYGVVWWVISGLMITPAATNVPVGEIAGAGLLGWAVYGLIAGPMFRGLYGPTPIREAARDLGRKVGIR